VTAGHRLKQVAVKRQVVAPGGILGAGVPRYLLPVIERRAAALLCWGTDRGPSGHLVVYARHQAVSRLGGSRGVNQGVNRT